VVAEKTGYPAEMLRLDMELEGDLGIDSIKRVEILSALQERAPGLPDIDGADLAALSTLGHITAHLNGLLRQPAPPATAKVSPPSAEPDAPPTVFRTTLSLHEAPPSGLIRAGLLGGRVYLSDDGQGLRGPLALALKDAGVQIVEEAVEADAAVFLGGLRPDPDAASVMGEALALARTLARRKATGLVTVQDTGGGFGLLPIPAGRATLAGLAGLARTAAIEWDGAAVKVIDLCLSELRAGRASPADLARRLADELVFGGPEREVGLPADGRRLTLADRPTPAPGPEALPLADGDVVLITGGARGVTAACALALAAQGSYRFALLGRSPLVHEPTAAWGVSDEAGLKRALASSAASPAALGRTVSAILAAREVRRTLDLLVTMGSEARYLAEDVTDYTALAAALQGLRQHWGPIAAVVHGAGVIADKRLEDKTQAQLDLVWSTKVTGAENLLAATAGDPLKVLCFFTSVAARVGNEGQADYAMANEALNKLARAEQARRPGCRVTALGWGPWEGGMVSPALRRHFAARGLPMLPLALGGEAFVAALGDPSVELVLGGEGFGGAAPRAAQDYDIQVDVDRLPFLLDHAIDGLPVIPVALVLEWFARAAGAFRPDLHLAALRDVRVVRGIPLPRPARLRLEVTHTANRDGCILVFKLRSEDSVLRYSATAEMTQYPPDTARPRGPALALEPWAGREIYDGHVLFHGPRFQVIRDMAGVSDQGIEGELAPGAEVGWAEGAYQTDPAAVDGGLQLAVLWSKHMIGGAALPTHIQAVRSFGLPVGRMRAVVQGREQGRKRTLSDLYLFNPDGGLVTLLEGVETHCRPDPA
jgi:NAD(P)-dependent dehydrogenase (short-subunit alcohol dehydrogenase family)/acyl carrier protein